MFSGLSNAVLGPELHVYPSACNHHPFEVPDFAHLDVQFIKQ